jgi:hypothetical protein
MSGYPRTYRNREVETTKSGSQHCASLQAVSAWMRSQVLVEVNASHRLWKASRDARERANRKLFPGQKSGSRTHQW